MNAPANHVARAAAAGVMETIVGGFATMGGGGFFHGVKTLWQSGNGALSWGVNLFLVMVALLLLSGGRGLYFGGPGIGGSGPGETEANCNNYNPLPC